MGLHGRFLFERMRAEIERENQTDCSIFDVGMNDAFYSNYGAYLGCHVTSFELQPACINSAITTFRLNNFQSRVRIFNQPVSDSESQLTIPLDSESTVCRGQFSFTRAGWEDKLSATNFTAIRLDKFIPSTYKVDILKIDVEGHDPQVLMGAEELFKRRQIRYVVRCNRT